jgi:CRP-like cAMP-binding protein
VPLFAPLAEEDLAGVAEHMELREVSPGQHLTTEGASGYFFFVIETGTADVSRDGTVVATLGPGDYFGETSILTAARRNATITSTSDMRLAVMFGADFAKLMADSPETAARVRAVMEERLPPS